MAPTMGYPGRLVGIEHYWTVIKGFAGRGEVFTIHEVAQQTAAHDDSVGDYVRRLVRGGYVEPAGWRAVASTWRPMIVAKARTYRALQSSGPAPSLRRDGSPGLYGLGRQQMWNILRGSQAAGGIDARQLALLASTSAVPVGIGTAKDFLKLLVAAGYLAVVRPAAHHRPALYRLHRRMNTGPLAPMISRAKAVVIDRNRGEALAPVLIEEDAT